VADGYRATIGIECHVQLNTKTKLFAGVDNDARDAEPNTLISPLCTGMPGTLPVLNAAAVECAIRAGVALGATIAHYSKFDRKHYFYPDLPLGYQITQFDEPTILSGLVRAPLADGSYVSVRIHHAHLEADAGKSTHPDGMDYSLVDLNRAGTPLIEIVSEPDMHTAEEAKAYARELYLLMKYAGVSDANLFYGNMRFDVNVSVSNSDELGTRTETKNLNSFRAVEKAVEFEIARQTEVLERGEKIVQETRGWDDARAVTFSQRSKEDAHDYRYFPDPDLPPIVLSDEQIESARAAMPLMPGQLREYMIQCGIDRMSAEALLDNPPLAKRWHEVASLDAPASALKKIGDWFANDILSQLAGSGIDLEGSMDSTPSLLNALQLITLAKMTEDNLISSSAAKALLAAHWTDLYDVEAIAKEMDLLQVSDEGELEMIVAQVMSENQKAAADVRAGETKAIGFLTGQVMKITAGKANPGVVQAIIKKLLGLS
jgi:aspartyl-tRNA(Asn)/glutamyl-tRNA(Gln) amidotransferase subunit B